MALFCPFDVAVLILNSKSGFYAGTSTGWFGNGNDGYGFSGSTAQVSQIGYPVCLHNGLYMERNDSYGYKNSTYSNNTVIGSFICGGSSGGPWLANLGLRHSLTGTTPGTAPDSNVVVGVTSWGYTSTGPKAQDASSVYKQQYRSVTQFGASVAAACN